MIRLVSKKSTWVVIDQQASLITICHETYFLPHLLGNEHEIKIIMYCVPTALRGNQLRSKSCKHSRYDGLVSESSRIQL